MKVTARPCPFQDNQGRGLVLGLKFEGITKARGSSGTSCLTIGPEHSSCPAGKDMFSG